MYMYMISIPVRVSYLQERSPTESLYDEPIDPLLLSARYLQSTYMYIDHI